MRGTRVVSRSCPAGAVANVDFSSCVVVNGSRVRKKIEKARQKSFELEQKRGNFYKPTGKEDKWFLLLCVGGKNRASDPNFGEKTASRFRSFETALSRHDFVCFVLKASDEIGQMDNRNQARWVYFLYLSPNGNMLSHRAISSIVILNSTQFLVQRAQIFTAKSVTQHRNFRQSRVTRCTYIN